MWTLLRRRVAAHRTALVAVATSVLTSMLVVAALQVLAGGIADAGTRAELAVPAAERGVVLSAGLRPGELGDVDRRVRDVLGSGGPGDLVRTATTTIRGLRGGTATDRVLLADLDRLQERARLVSGGWPAAPAPGAGPLEAVVPENVAAALELAPGDRLTLPDLVDPASPAVDVVVTGVVTPTGVEEGRWADDPLARAGVARTDFTTYGPVVLAAGAFDTGAVGASTVTWRWTPDVEGMTTAALPALQDRVDGVVDALDRLVDGAAAGLTAGPPLRDARVTTALPETLDRAADTGARVRAALLAPTVLLVVLGTASLVVAAALLAALREPETRLLRTRGASTARLAGLSLADATAVVALGAAGSLLLAPLLARWVAGAVGLSSGELSTGSSPWPAVLLMGVLATAVVVSTTLRVGRARGGLRADGGRARVLRTLGSSGLDVALVALSVLGVVQLRRYDGTGSGAADPLTVAAPALVVAGSAVVCLRLLPVLSRQVARMTTARRGLDVAWGGWQLSRRLAAQSGTVLLVLLAVSMGTLALAHSATARQAVEDQSAFATGGSVRVSTGAVGGADLSATAARLDEAGGGVERVSPVLRETADLGQLDGVTVLALDAASAPRVVQPRSDTLEGQDWTRLTRRLVAGRPAVAAPTLPADSDELTLRLRLDVPTGGAVGLEAPASVQLRDGSGLVSTLASGSVTTRSTVLTVDLPAPRRGPWQLLGVTGSLRTSSVTGGGSLPPVVQDLPGASGATLVVESADVGGAPVGDLDLLAPRPSSDTLVTSVPAPQLESVPALVTRSVAAAAGVREGSTFEVPVAGRRLPVEVAGVVGSVPTAAVPERAVVLDLPTVLVAPEPPAADRRLPGQVLVPTEWWLAPPGGAVDAAALRAELPGAAVEQRAEVVQRRLDNPVNAGMRAAMALVTAAALVLAAVGFAATTAALGRDRRRENAVLLALGMPPARIRRTLEAERLAVVVLTVVVGLGLGVLCALAVVPVLVGGDGFAQVPGVVVALPWPLLATYATVVAVVLAVVALVVLRRLGGEVATELRRGES